ncbi:MAG: PfkB family carbohydrate kinase [Actinomycetota bacterium]
MSQPTALSFGESVVDIYPDRRVVAGSPVHLAAHLARRGWEVTLATRLGDDPDAAEIREVLRLYGISEVAVESDPLLPSGSVTIYFDENGHRFHIHKPAAWDSLELLEIPDVDVVCFGSLIGRSPVARSALERLLAQDFAMRVFDVNLRPPDVHLETIRRGLEAATVVKVSDDELAEVTRSFEVRPEVNTLFDVGKDLEWVAVTHGSRGAELWHRSGRSWWQPAAEMQVTDAVGAGDAFAAGLVHELWHGADGKVALAGAMSAAESILGQRGGLPSVESRKGEREL